MEEIEAVLKKLCQHKAPREEKLNLELFKYEGQHFNRRFLLSLNRTWLGEHPPPLAVSKKQLQYQLTRNKIWKTENITEELA